MTSIGTDSSVNADLGMVRKDSLEGVICSGLHDSDVSCCQVIVSCAFIFVMFQFVTVLKSVDEERLQRQVLAPRVPVSRIRNLDDASIDLLPLDGFEPWVYSDLVQNPFQETDNLRRYCETALTAVCVGDLNAVVCCRSRASPSTFVSRILANSVNVASSLCLSPFCHVRRRLCRRPFYSSNGSFFPIAFEG